MGTVTASGNTIIVTVIGFVRLRSLDVSGGATSVTIFIFADAMALAAVGRIQTSL